MKLCHLLFEGMSFDLCTVMKLNSLLPLLMFLCSSILLQPYKYCHIVFNCEGEWRIISTFFDICTSQCSAGVHKFYKNVRATSKF
jgi:hypothetical protein